MHRYLFIFFLFSIFLHAHIVEYHLTVAEKTITLGNKTSTGLAINDSIPAPTLEFTEGDVARIHVTNSLKKEATSLHWHGLLLPNNQDGVPYLNTPPIAPGELFTYEFPLTHSGTFWYHSHFGLQEQRGLYGGIIVHPKKSNTAAYDRDYVMVLSEFTHEDPKAIMRTLMRSSNYYSIRKGTMQSIAGAIKQGSLRDYWQREKSRLLPMDVSDIAYDAFFINGLSTQYLPAKANKRIRLRIINAGASSYFYINSAFPNMTIIAADSNDVQPLKTEQLLLGMGETYDIVVTMPANGAFEIRSTAQDISGHASLILGNGLLHQAKDLSRPNYYNMDNMLNQALDIDDDPLHPHSSPYKFLRALKKTTYKNATSSRSIDLHLTGDMERYRWSFNNKTLYEESTISVKRGEVLRINLVNDSMMHHPIHLHGHFFRMINEAGDYSPLKHTVDLPPMGSRTIEFLANEHGDWIFHCHLLYHMDAGMARVISYVDQGADHQPNLGPSAREPWYWMIDGVAQTNMTMGMASLMWGRENFNLDWEHGMVEDDDHSEENQFVWSHYFNPNISSLAGYRFSLHDSEENHFFAGVRYRLPYLIKSEISFNDELDGRIALSKSFQISSRLSLMTRVQYDTSDLWEYGANMEYTLNKNYGLSGGYDSNHGWGVGIDFHF